MRHDENPKSIRRLGLIAGEGDLPVSVIRNALSQGLDTVVFSVGKDNRSALKQAAHGKFHEITPGLFAKNIDLLRKEAVSHIVFAGKVNKWLLFRNPQMDSEALKAFHQLACRNDDSVMLGIISILNEKGFEVVSQSRFLANHFVPEAILTDEAPTAEEQKDIDYGMPLAKEMGRLDIGQTLVVSKQMVLAVEAIEGTDECLKRAGQWGRKKGGVVLKVAKPNQDQRFDIPTVGVKTLKTMRSAGLRVLATEAHQTLFLDKEAMIAFANKHNMVITSVSLNAANTALPATPVGAGYGP